MKKLNIESLARKLDKRSILLKLFSSPPGIEASPTGDNSQIHQSAALLKVGISRTLTALTVAVALMLTPVVVWGQADFEKGYQAFQSYHGSDFDTVNLANGNLVLNIPLLSYGQRGGIPPLVISIRSNSTTFQSTPTLVSGPADTNQHEIASGVIGAPWGQPHVSISPGGISWKEDWIVTGKTASGPEYLVRFVAIDDSGATHSLGGSISNSTAGYISGIRYSVDGSGFMLQPGNTTTGPVLVDRKGNTGGLIDSTGNAITLKGTCSRQPGSGDYFEASLPAWEGYAHGTSSASSIVDTIGRTIPNPEYLPAVAGSSCLVDIDASYYPISPNATPCETWDFPAENGGTVPLIFCYAQIPVSANIPQPNGSTLVYERINETWKVLTSVTLPNQTQWKFSYDNYGQVDQVIMPTGAMVTYQYATRLACGNPPGQIPVTGTPTWPYSNILSSRMVTQRSVYENFNDIENSVPPIEVWTYNNKIGSGWAAGPSAQTSEAYDVVAPGGPNSGEVTVTDPAGNATVHTFSLIGGSTCGPYETKTQYYQGSSTLLKEVDTAYSNTGPDFANPTNFSNYIAVGVFPQTVTTTLPAKTTSLVSQDTYQHDDFGSYEDYAGRTHPFSFGQVLSSGESDWGSSTPIRTTLHTKLWQSNFKYYAANLIDLPCLDTILSGSYTGSNPQPSCTAPTPAANQVEQTSYEYDESAYTGGATTLGNQTSVTHWLQGGPIGSWPTTHNVCHSTSFGMPLQKWDANGNITSLSYDASGLYLNKIQYADGSFETPGYDDNTGTLLSNTDVNNQKTSYSYDAMRRLTGVNFPDKGSESLQYVDTPGELSLIFTKSINTSATILGTSYPASSLAKVALADGLGRLTETQVTSDPFGSVEVDTTYDSLGRVATVSNPYRSKGESTYGITTFIYDALNRKSLEVAPDGSIKQTCFNGISTVGQTNCRSNILNATGTWEDDADENGNDWQRTRNALGQMTHVAEPSGSNSAPSMETDYSNDALGNLLTVNQKGSGTDTPRTARTFTYDTLSRLLSAFNLERGADSYTYDANGNLLTKSSPMVNATSGTQTIGYCYDHMNRLVGRWSTTPPSGCATTPTTITASLLDAYTFGAAGSGSGTVGRLTDEKAYMSGVLVAENTLLQYDPMGRLQVEQQTPYSLTSAQNYTFNYSYDLAGNLITANNGLPSTSTPLGFTLAYDAADRLQLLATTTQPAAWVTAPPTGSSSAYYPQLLLQANAQTKGELGNNPYDAMGHLTNAQLSLQNPTDPAAGILLSRTYDNRGRILSELDVNNVSAPIYSYQIPSGGYALNGNILAHNDSVTGAWTFQYDTLNRLIGAGASSGSYAGEAGCWTYDGFGNRAVEAFSTVTSTPCASGANDNSQLTSRSFNTSNQDTGFNYDAAGNVLSDGQNTYLYDIDGNLCAVAATIGPISIMTQYLYNAAGIRVANGSITGLPGSCAALGTGFTPTNEYLLGPSGEQVTELTLTGSGSALTATTLHTNAYIGSHLLATYDFTGATPGLHFSLADPLGTKRVQAAPNGAAELNCLSFPFGNDLGNPRITNCLNLGTSTASDATEHHFTGKERDAESGNDYFGARYYGSTMGRFMSPDWSAKIEPVPYSKLDNPQSLNLYSYTLNNPLSNVDTDGHACSGILGNSSSGFCDRATEYGKIDGNATVRSQTRFFAAASAVSSALADVDAPGSSLIGGISGQTSSFLEGVGQKLEAFNEGEAHLIASGNLSGPGLDQQLVHSEQTVVQGSLDSLKQSSPDAYNQTISQINGALNPGSNTLAGFASTRFPTDKAYAGVLDGVRKDLGRNIDFSKQSDREAIGNALVNHVRQNGGCDVTGSKGSGCN